MTAEAEALLEVVPTIRFGRQRKTHGYKVGIDGQRVYLHTRCGIDTTDAEYTVTHGVVSCTDCELVAAGDGS